MPAPVCITCQRTMTRKKSGINIEYKAKRSDGTQKPYQVWMSDLFVCPGCGTQVASGFGYEPCWQHFYKESKPEPIAASVEER